MAKPEHITTHGDLALARVLQQYVGKPRIAGQISAHATQIQAAEDALWQLMVDRYLATAVGYQLDRLGAVVFEPRGSLGDAQYALTIAARIRMLRSSGTVPDLIAVFAALGETAIITQWFPACFELLIESLITAATAALYVSFVRRSRVAGVRGILRWQEVADANCFTLSDAADCPVGAPYLELDTNTGLGDATDPTAGGCLTGAAE